ncbi:MAG: Do family serine endopeptidase [Candidatus Omnitrophota bacterium]|nr:Do family serine endopeptidase [Candidatus Omnitrophota bacterium]
MKRNAKLLFIIFGFLSTAIIGFSDNARALEPQGVAYPDSFEKAVEEVADTVGKAVVSISIEHTEKVGASSARRYQFGGPQGGGPLEDEFFRRFFEDFFGELPQREYKQLGLGSGVIIDPQGYILTNEHVVGEADKITVTLPDGREFKAEIKGVDKRSDLAVIKIEGRDFPAVGLGDSDNLRIGQWVVAIGNPFGFAIHNPEPTVTAGVVSALHRSLGRISSDRDYGDLIQTDAAINPGNSGGPLVNLKGEIVGINVAIFSTSGGYQGIGFAVPSNSAKRIVSKLIEGKKVIYGWLGITIQNLDDKLAGYFGLAEKKGVLVSRVLEDSPAAKAGIKNGDIIIRIDGQETNNASVLLKIVGNSEPGGKIKLDIQRDKKPLSLNAAIGSRPENIDELGKPEARETSSDYWRGIKVEAITPDSASKSRLGDYAGVAVVDVQPDSPAEEAGIVSGDVILEINRIYIDSIAVYKKVIQAAKGDCLARTARGFFVIKSE